VQTTVRLVGINLSNLIENINLQITSELFDDYKKSDGHKKSCEAEIIEKINKKFAKDIIDIATEKLR
jgi:hypothetical protein